MPIAGYEIAAEIGGGGPYRLYRARRTHDDRAVLLKVFAPAAADPQEDDALGHEFEVLRLLSGTGVPRACDLVRTADGSCLVLEDRQLQPLTIRIGVRPVGLGAFFTIARQVCALLGMLHARNVIHASVSPGAIMVSASLDEVQLFDLHAAVRSPADNRAPAALATPYASPEQTGRITRAIDYRADFYSLGATLYELLAGVPPFRADDPLELIHAHLARNPIPPDEINPDVPNQVSRIVLRLMAKAPEDRYQSTAGIARDLEICERQWSERRAIEPFEPGQHDVPERVVASRRLYGRDREIRQLLDAFEEAAAGRTAMMLVGGYAGIGKTALIQELYKPIVRQQGYVVSGKFDQVVRNIPYGALIQAFRSLIWQLLTEREDRLQRWRALLRDALGANAGVLAEVIPEIELIVGRQEPPPPLDPAEAQNRFQYVLQRFVGAVARRDHPLVVFLDDLQWVDPATLGALRTIATTPDIRHLLVICAYRDNEPNAEALVTWAVESIASAGTRVHQVSLGALAPEDLALFLRDTFRADGPEVYELARLVHARTGGNPFFVIQFLQTLEHDQLIAFNRARGRWSFDLDAIARTGLTDNIIDLMTRKIRRLPPHAQDALTLAACIGNQFDWTTFSVATRQPLDQAAAGLSEALQSGLIHLTVPTAGGAARGPAYAFLHDRVQQAAYALIPDERKKPVHLDVGRLLLAQHAGEVPDERLFEIVNHLNIGASLISDPHEQITVAELNLAAGRKARSSAAYDAAAGYFEAGIAQLQDEHWHTAYRLTFDLHLESAEAQYLTGSFDRADDQFTLLLGRARSRLDAGQVHSLRIVLSENRSRWAEAVQRGREALASFGVVLPALPQEGQAALVREIETTQQLLAGRPIASLVDLPVMSDPEMRMAMRILTSLWAPAYVSGDQVLARLISATMVRLSLTHGNTEDSAYGYVTHAITIGPIRKDYQAAYEWGELALSVNERFADLKRRAKIHQQFQAHVSLWCRPFAACIPHAREARRIGLENGDFTYAGYGAMSESWPALLIARNLGQFVQEYWPTLDFLKRLKMTDFRAAHRVVLNWARALQGLTVSPLSLSDETFDEHAFVARYNGNAVFLSFFYTAKLHLAVMMGEYEQAIDAARRAREGALAGTIWPVLIDAWGGLALAAMREGTAGAAAQARLELDAIEQKLRPLAASCPENYRCFHLLLSAGIASADGELAAATRLCEEALVYARQSSSIQHEALACELLARAWLARGQQAGAAGRLKEAVRAFAAWGAAAKVAQLQQHYADLLAPAGSERAEADRQSASRVYQPSTLDMATVVKLAHTIAVHIEVGKLLEELMKLALENAGADRGIFLLERDGQLLVAATASANPPAVRVGGYVPLEQAPDLAHSVVRYVHRTGQDVVVDAASADERFAADPYLRTTPAASLLCVPVGRLERRGGVLYLENTLAPQAFSPKRTEMMRILAAQTAISLENARLYEEMRAEVERRTTAERALRSALGELQALKDRLEAENVYLQEEIRTQHNFNDIIGNSPALLESLHKVERVAPTESTVLIVGETGSGKELFARAVHSRSGRSGRPLVKVNCGAIAPGLVESELFGHVKGAFTGAIDKRIGRFEVADAGTIFLDEIGELPLEAQVKLLRVLQEQEFEPVGSSRTIRVSVRVIAATNRDLDRAVAEGKFRADLLYRLNVFPIEVPPLRQRGADVELLARFFVSGLARRLGKPLQGFSHRSMERLKRYSWPGNVRELQNVVERAAILARGPIIESEDLQLGPDPPRDAAPLIPAARSTLDDAQRAHIVRVLAMTRGVIEGPKGAAAVLGLHANTLRSRMKKLGITPSAWRSPQES